jgi:hypothetical protein
MEEAGTGLIGASAGVTVFLVLMLLAVQVLFNLYATSAVTAAAYDAARIAAGFDGDPAGRWAAENHVRQVLGRYAEAADVEVQMTPQPDDVVLTVTASNPGFLPVALRRPLAFDTIERTVRVRIERPRG